MDIPHGGTETPEELASYVALDESALLKEADAGSREIYMEMEQIPAANKLFFPYWRSLIDVNRELHDLGKDGIIKTKTSAGKDIYHNAKGLPFSLILKVIDKYANKYYEDLRTLVARPETRLVVLGHTMSAEAPEAFKYAGRPRPLITLANGGNREGQPNQPYQLPFGLMEHVSGILDRHLEECRVDGVTFNDKRVSFNHPFSGRKSIARIGEEALRGKTAFMIEVNKSLLRHPENIVIVKCAIYESICAVLENLE